MRLPRKARLGKIDDRWFICGGLLPQRAFVTAGRQVEYLTVTIHSQLFQAVCYYGESTLIAGGQRFVEEQRQGFPALFLCLDPGQAQSKQQLHAGA